MCGLVGIFSTKNNVSQAIYLGLYALQHRGQEGAGIAVLNNNQMNIYKRLGLLSEIFSKEVISSLTGSVGIGHTRYSTTGSFNQINTQPIVGVFNDSPFAIAHNGNLTNSAEIRLELENKGVKFETSMDTEIFVHLIKDKDGNFPQILTSVLSAVYGSYSLVIIANKKLYGVRDVYGFRPLVLGKTNDSIILCSETCALDYIGAEFIKEISPGEIVEIDAQNINSYYINSSNDYLAQCIFEFIYFARPDSTIFNKSVNDIRIALGRELAKEYPVDADLVMDVPDSGTSAALGFSQESKIPYSRGFVRSHFIGRTFIIPFQLSREVNLKLKLNPIKSVVKDKRIVIVDDSIVRGNTAKFRVSQLRQAGAKEVHYRIASAPIKFPCFFGIDFPTKKELIAANLSISQIEREIQVDSLRYLSIDRMLKVVGGEKNYCYACFSGKYKVSPPISFSKNMFE